MDAILTVLHLYSASYNPTWSSNLAGWMLPPTIMFALLELLSMQQKRAFKKKPKNNGKILDTGLWGIVRNPNYIVSHAWRFTQGVALFGWPGLLFGWGMLKDAIDNQIPGVEWYMQRKYGEKYDAYKAKVPYRLIPGIY
ncbi:putative membrane protein [Phaeoacremonium minimum UCRPA7]|uniref:Putative membrane protein n=1 Tax=Phaeoacremonium minimum (strain UCR-PA7) TaxID=1286976 RepID=R8BFA1_PHAM7|nr:putative membrane protein [Phaeoacremonium minimum UCRPA7]EON97967.1 putative membrane protein [Phaeoacremonium minimum UCRPA7]